MATYPSNNLPFSMMLLVCGVDDHIGLSISFDSRSVARSGSQRLIKHCRNHGIECKVLSFWNNEWAGTFEVDFSFPGLLRYEQLAAINVIPKTFASVMIFE